jgi:hypothetical protein
MKQLFFAYMTFAIPWWSKKCEWFHVKGQKTFKILKFYAYVAIFL